VLCEKSSNEGTRRGKVIGVGVGECGYAADQENLIRRKFGAQRHERDTHEGDTKMNRVPRPER
jgi:hypothetical protein